MAVPRGQGDMGRQYVYGLCCQMSCTSSNFTIVDASWNDAKTRMDSFDCPSFSQAGSGFCLMICLWRTAKGDAGSI